MAESGRGWVNYSPARRPRDRRWPRLGSLRPSRSVDARDSDAHAPTLSASPVQRPPVAVFGASEREESVAGTLFRNLRNAGYEGEVYPVNPTHETVFGERGYASAMGLTAIPELALIATPPTVAQRRQAPAARGHPRRHRHRAHGEAPACAPDAAGNDLRPGAGAGDRVRRRRLRYRGLPGPRGDPAASQPLSGAPPDPAHPCRHPPGAVPQPPAGRQGRAGERPAAPVGNGLRAALAGRADPGLRGEPVRGKQVLPLHGCGERAVARRAGALRRQPRRRCANSPWW